MKKVRLLIAMILVFAALTIGVMAAETDYIGFEAETIETGDAVVVKVVSKNGYDAETVTFDVFFAADKWTISELSNTDSADNGGSVGYMKDSCTVEAGATILSFKATPVGGAASVVGETFTLTNGILVTKEGEVPLEGVENFDTLTVVAAGPSIVYGDAAECAKEWTTAKSETDNLTHTFQNVAVAEAKFNAAANASEAGFVFAKNAADGTYGQTLKVLDTTAIAGDGTVEYAVVLYAVPYGEDLTALYAKPYYVPAN